MATQLQITKKLHITPLINIQSATFAKRYVDGCYWRLFGWRIRGEIKAQGLLPDSYLVNNLKMSAKLDRFDGHHDEQLRSDVGFFIGMLHGGVLTSTGVLRPDMESIVIINNQDFREGYERGKHNYFEQGEGMLQTENDLLELLKWYDEDNLYLADERGTLNWAIGCIVGELGERLFSQDRLERNVETTNNIVLQEA